MAMAESEQKPAVKSVTIPEPEYQLMRRIAFQEERTQQDVLAEAVRALFGVYAKGKDQKHRDQHLFNRAEEIVK